MAIVYKNTRSQSTFVELGRVRYSKYRLCSSQSTKASDGKTNFAAQNQHAFIDNTLLSYYAPSPDFPELYPGGVVAELDVPYLPGLDLEKIEQTALAKFNGRLRKGRASLGVTLGSWSQSSSMITRRLQTASRGLEKVYLSLKKDRKRLRRIRHASDVNHTRDPLASLVLEGEFGWRPLVEDISSALKVIAGGAIPPVFITGRHREGFVIRNVYPEGGGSKGVLEEVHGTGGVTIAATCVTSNPNSALLNQLGLLNPLGVIWDLIPWSFVVGMFVNVSAMIQSLTDEIGLDIANKSVTRSVKTEYSLHMTLAGNVGGKKTRSIYKQRSVGSLPAVKWQVRVPELNKEQMLIAAALVLQRFTKINHLISI